jgi:AcrR family transcriptional regulator
MYMARKAYHNVQMRETLLGLTVKLVAESGSGFTMRELARRAGVSHAAVYRHFRDREALIDAVAAQGFRDLTRAMRDAAGSQKTPMNRLKRSGSAYVSFALKRPRQFAVMFDWEQADDKLALDTLVKFVKECQREGHLAGDAQRWALLAWAQVHGIAKLANAGRLPYSSDAEVLSFAGFALDALL